ncbi:type IV toxin-antitoxin system AbiEi family antitoxin domain-containing protein [Gordonia polyisoprenivorans]|uniref:type IV toxin-antitoxin system AbiEi family antitoxin domain-containing protein n=1 Tax=Gordonia polyisoprenivorans TaxID=84595 RepID=UPI0022FFFE66|nr:type IV toxin-antitoxin system AbiEi family antitoxin domain-containing protein [Gordonia polyisoprenivorans]WCB36281.1 type IV toxin-antitoxin system AbiEi family antitoxin domain-containing protein [Gordonia polyisoprenivorans]
MDIHELSVRRDGVFTTREALDCGVSESAIARRVASGAWKEVAHGVHLVAGHARGPRAQARIAVLSVHKNAVLGGAAAAWWLGLCSDEPRKHLVFTQTRGRARRSSATAVSRYRELDDDDIVVHDGLRTTAADLTVLEASVALGLSFMDSALLSGRVTPESLADVHARYPKRHGAAQASAYLRLIGDGARSEAERLTVRIFRAAGVSGWVANLPTCGYVIDFAFPDQKVAVEIDGFAYHRDAVAFQRDRTKRNALMRSGWQVLNYTWADLIDRPDQVAAEVAAALRSPAA